MKELFGVPKLKKDGTPGSVTMVSLSRKTSRRQAFATILAFVGDVTGGVSLRGVRWTGAWIIYGYCVIASFELSVTLEIFMC